MKPLVGPRKATGQYVSTDPSVSFIYDSRSAWVFLAVVVSVLAVVAACLCLMPYARVQTVTGALTPIGGIVRVASSAPGRVRDLAITDGTRVHAGQVIADIAPLADLDRGGVADALRAAVLGRIEANDARFLAEVEVRKARIEALEIRLATLFSDLGSLRRQVALSETQANLRQDLVARLERLEESGYAAGSTVVQRRVDLLTQQQQLEAAKLAVSNQQRQISTAQAELLQLRLESRSASADREILKRQTEEELITIESGGGSAYRSPIDGTVVAAPNGEGQSVSAGSVIAVIAPAGAELEAEILVPSASAGFLERGQPVRLKYDAYPYREYGVASGLISSIAPAALAASDLGDRSGAQSGSFVRVRVSLVRQTIHATGRDLPLRAGMTFSADIVSERQPLGLALFRALIPKGSGQ